MKKAQEDAQKDDASLKFIEDRFTKILDYHNKLWITENDVLVGLKTVVDEIKKVTSHKKTLERVQREAIHSQLAVYQYVCKKMNLIGPKLTSLKTLEDYNEKILDMIRESSNEFRSNQLVKILNFPNEIIKSIILHAWSDSDTLEETLVYGEINQFITHENQSGGNGDFEITYRVSNGLETLYITPSNLAADFTKGFLTFVENLL